LGNFVILAARIGGDESTRSEFLESIAKLLPEGFVLKIPPGWDEETLCMSAKDADAILGSRVSRDLILSAPKVRLIQILGSGVDKVDVETAVERGVTVCNCVGENAVPVAEHAIALMLALSKSLQKYQRDLASGRWAKTRPVMLSGKSLGIIGLGSIGLEVAKRVRPFDMKVLAIKKHPRSDLKEKLGLTFLGAPENLEYILAKSDFVLLSLVLTQQTRGMMGQKQFASMKDGAYFINVARGELVDEVALVDALKSGKLAGAGLDVFQTEPVKPDNPLLKLDNVILTPHIGGGVWPPELTPRRIAFLVNNIVKALKGERPDNIVDPVLKYAHRTTPLEI
jgi:phosphoglycerate dehydrogenase-like enzyme